MKISQLTAQLQALGANPRHQQHLLRHWVLNRPLDAGKRPLDDFLPLRVRQALPDWQALLGGLLQLRSRHVAEDGTRLLLALADGQSVEAVLLPRQGVCVSTQVGCAVGCTFCMTGRDGLLRQLGSAEIVAQVVLARQLVPAAAPIKKVVLMGMGEPAHNLDNVLEAVQLLGTTGQIGHKQIVVSSVGDARLFDALMALPEGSVRPALALSLHTSNAQRRAQLLPRAPHLPPDELVARALAYQRHSGYPVQVQWTLLAGVNDGDDEVEGAVRLLAHQGVVLNLIPYNTGEGMPHARPSAERAAEMARQLHRRGVLTKLRHSAAQQVDGGCGQLRARSATGARVYPLTPAPAGVGKGPASASVPSPSPS